MQSQGPTPPRVIRGHGCYKQGYVEDRSCVENVGVRRKVTFVEINSYISIPDMDLQYLIVTSVIGWRR